MQMVKDDYFGRVHFRGGFRWPHKLPKGRVLVHNQVAHTIGSRPGERGSRCWTQDMDKGLVRCRCGWRGVEHYRVRGLGSDRAYTSDEIEQLWLAQVRA
jgi:hypothetical protein